MTDNTISHENIQFKVNDHVVYPLQGVGEVIRIEERDFEGKRLLYYIIYIPVSDLTIMAPVHKAAEIGIRPIVSKEEAQEALNFMAENPQAGPSDWKTRYQMNYDLLKKGNIMDIAKVVRALYYRSKIKELPIMERKLFDSALKILIDEISFSLEIPVKEVNERIFNKLEEETQDIDDDISDNHDMDDTDLEDDIDIDLDEDIEEEEDDDDDEEEN